VEPLTIFGTQLVFSILVWSLLAKWFAIPKLSLVKWETAVLILIIPHMFRHIGLSFLVPGIPVEPLPNLFALPTAYGDFISAILAIITMIAIRNHRSFAVPLIWVFNTFGTLDLLKALSNPDVVPLLGGTWYIPTMLVPLLLVSHALIYVWLFKPRTKVLEDIS
jgi:hypothetical protein